MWIKSFMYRTQSSLCISAFATAMPGEPSAPCKRLNSSVEAPGDSWRMSIQARQCSATTAIFRTAEPEAGGAAGQQRGHPANGQAVQSQHGCTAVQPVSGMLRRLLATGAGLTLPAQPGCPDEIRRCCSTPCILGCRLQGRRAAWSWQPEICHSAQKHLAAPWSL